ncbi:MAG: OmpA family protein [Bacteroidales bacterium]|nr:OmpA family protein [Bacteroidales bacterium]MCF8387844.1 OmpA family protein [Bacteroidales bacterium]MCF8397108.1 OmpA family protein [Bacteroidales bacterium]
MKTKILSCLVLFFAMISCIQAQKNVEFDKDNFPDDQKKTVKEMIDRIDDGIDLLEEEPPHYAEALELFLVANDFNPNNAMLNYNIGKCYLHTIQKAKSIPYLEHALKLDPNVAANLKYLLAMGYHYNYEFDKAIDFYTKYKHSLTPFELTEYGAAVEKQIEECQAGKELLRNPIRVFIDNLGNAVNTKFDEYTPVINADETILMFTSTRDNTTGGDIDSDYNTYYEDIYITEKDGEVWRQAVNPGKPLNEKSHDAVVGLSSDAQYVLIYKGEKNGGDIYICWKEEGEWQNPDDLPKEINTDYHETSATFSPDMKTLYFVSDKEGGYGGSDIYYARVEENSKPGKFKFEDAINMGSAINTPFDEEGVFMQADGRTLYFSSKGHKNMGGYDIFKTVYSNGTWSEPENIGYPVNTPDDDVFFSVNLTGKHGYYSSFDEHSFGGRDLYMVTFLGPEKPVMHQSDYELLAFEEKPQKETMLEEEVELKEFALVMIRGKIMDQLTHSPLGVMVEIIDNQTNQLIASFISNEQTGEYLVSLPSGKSYGLAVKAKEYLFHSENFDIPPTTEVKEMYKDIYLKKVEVGSKIILKNIFFEFNKSNLRPESIPELERLVKLLNDVPTLKIEISGHTDNVGSQLYNQELSEKRAKAVVDYLLDKGIDEDRLTYKGYGFSQPIAGNDTEEGRAMNRRTEFKVISK